ncbi:opsin 7%2C group member a [Xyrichtys novacula]|uniref:Opsin 7, group member a n=1 Tax=Xyrichtys novacula TaxID=13765 RepID=A0AAV1GH74_XYRNO|nr:opsin 7%2C group member a [Xyrichtys novacula]
MSLSEDVAFRSNIPVPLDITVAVVYSIFGICSLFGNSTLLYVSYKKKHLLKPAEYFIINLAVSDLGLTLSLYPMAITSSLYHRWLYGKTVCSIYAFCGMLFGICSLTTLTLLSVVCFVKVCFPLYGILLTVNASRKNMEQHAPRQTHISSIQAIITKLSVAVCIGFFAAWSPYAVVSMWAAFGHIENIHPVAFAMPAMFAKSSTIYNPIIYLMLRPNFRMVMRRDLGTLCHSCVRSCLCSGRPTKCHSKTEIRVKLRTIHRQTNQIPSSKSSAQPPKVAFKDRRCEKCKDAFECFRHYPQMCSVTNPAANRDSFKDQDGPAPQTQQQKTQSVCSRKSLLASMCAKRTSEVDNFHINLEMVPGHAKVAWP